MQTMIINNTESETMETLAAALGANYSSEYNTIYKGSNPESGICITLESDSEYGSGSASLCYSLYGDDESFKLSGKTVCYENSGSCCVFGTPQTYDGIYSNVQCAIVPYNSPGGGGYLHIICLSGFYH
jgi:hypothetical protein